MITEKRKEVVLATDTLKTLAKLATEDNRSLKNYMEKILIEHTETQKRLKPYLNSKSKK